MIANAKRFGTFILIVTLVISASFGLLFLRFQQQYANRIFPHVYIGSHDMGGQTVTSVKQFFDEKNQALAAHTITVTYQNANTATFSASMIKVQYDSGTIADRAFLIGHSADRFADIKQQLTSLLRLGNYHFDAHLQYDASPLREYITNLETIYNKDAKNALFKFANGRVVSFRPEEKGLSLDEDMFFDHVGQTISGWQTQPENTIITVTDHVIDPEITLAKANNFGIQEEIGSGQSDYSHSIPARIHNVLLAASKFDGVLIPQGQEFSFNDTVGDISSDTGYEPAYIIKDGKTVLGDGGGVCQVSTTLFRAALNAGMPITQRFAHAYRVGYYENDSSPGFDATVFAPYADFKFKNDTPAPILIQTEIDKDHNILKFLFFGKKDGRKVEISPVSVYDVTAAPPPRYQDDPTLKKGVVKQTDFAAPGTKANFTYRVSLNDKVLFATNFFSSYQPWQAVFLVGTAD